MEIYGKKLPDWLNAKFLLEIIELKCKIKQSKFRFLDKTVSAIDGYKATDLGAVYRVVCEVHMVDDEETQKVSLIIKGQSYADLGEFGCYQKELFVYRNIIPLFEREWLKIGKTVTFAPTVYKITSDPAHIITMEDLLAERNYKLGNQIIGLDLDHLKIVVEKISKFHAASLVAYNTNGDFGKLFHENHVENLQFELKLIYDFGMVNSWSSFIEIFRKYDNLKPYYDKIIDWKVVGLKEFTRCCNAEPNGLNVMNHGDCVTQNLMFSYDDDFQPNDVLLIDYQQCVYGPPLIDLYFILILCASSHFQDTNNFIELIKFYYDTLKDNLFKLNYVEIDKVPKYKDFLLDVIDKGFFGVVLLTGTLGVTVYNPSEDKTNYCKNELYLQALDHLLGFFDRFGLLEL